MSTFYFFQCIWIKILHFFHLFFDSGAPQQYKKLYLLLFDRRKLIENAILEIPGSLIHYSSFSIFLIFDVLPLRHFHFRCFATLPSFLFFLVILISHPLIRFWRSHITIDYRFCNSTTEYDHQKINMNIKNSQMLRKLQKRNWIINIKMEV